MSLDRFNNKEDILAASGVQPVRPSIWTDEIANGPYLISVPLNIYDNKRLDFSEEGIPAAGNVCEVNLFNINDGTYADTVTVDFVRDSFKDSLNFNAADVVSQVSFKNGQYLGIINLLQNRLGSEIEPAFYIQEISTDRTEIYIRGNTKHPDYTGTLSDIDELLFEQNPHIAYEIQEGYSVLNFGKNRIVTILSKAAWDDPDGMVLKLLKPLPEDLAEQSTCWLQYEICDPILKFFNFIYNEMDRKVYLRTANFDANTDYNTITETDFATYSQLLGSSTSTSEQIIQQLLSGSFADSPIGVDYSAFDNFVFYSSAAERLANFKYKIQQIEHYDNQIELLAASASHVPTLGADKLLAENRKNEVIGTFDGFEKWLYYESTSSLFTHQAVYDTAHRSGNPTRLEGGVLGSDVYQIQPYPKFLTASADADGGGKYVLHASDSTIATNWYNGTLASASLYDEFNESALVTTIPEHIRLDSNNDQYELFVNMIGHHYDILYSYADALAKTYHPIEHPKLGHTKDTLYNVAKSLGWKLFNGNQASALWQYKLGYGHETGSLRSTGSIFTKSDEAITTEVWRRIVNNLPYLLKTKGTARGVKALMNTYGIPQTLLSIREYGGPKVAEDVPLLIEDRFSYALQVASGSQVEYNRDKINFADLGGRGIDAQNNPTFTAPAGISNSQLNNRAPDTIEFRFKPAIKQSMYLLSHRPSANNKVHWNLGIQHTGSYSGSTEYGRLFFQFRDLSGNTGTSQLAGSKYDEKIGNSLVAYSDYVPLYDGEFWNTRLFTAYPFVTSSHVPGDDFVPDIFFETQKASDYISDKIIHRTSGSMNVGSGSDSANGDSLMKYWAHDTSAKVILIGGDTGSGLMGSTGILGAGFSGSIQEYREWMEVLDQTAFDLHTTNPTSYVSSINPTSSFDTLVRHYPFGTDLNAVDHSTGAGLFVTSSHPDQAIQDFTSPLTDSITQHAAMSQFPTPYNAERGNYEPVEETYYIQGVSLGGSLPKSQKIRFDDNELITRLSPTNTAEQSKFDNASLDSNRLGLFYSMADQINKEIFNQIGDVALDDYVGDPDDQYELTYPDLNSFAKDYWKKYSDRNDINAFMRIFSQFDFSLFESIRQMLPDRADEVMGLLVEPHALERSKAVPFKRPEQAPAHYDGFLDGLSPTASGDYPYFEGVMIGTPSLAEADTSFHVGDNGYSDHGNYRGDIILNTSSSTDYFTKQIFPVDERPAPITSSILNIYAVHQGEYHSNGERFLQDEDARYILVDTASPTGGANSIRTFTGTTGGSLRMESSFKNRPFASDKLRVQFDTYCQTDTIQDCRVNVTWDDIISGNNTDDVMIHARLITTENNQAVDLIYVSSSNVPATHITETAVVTIDEGGGVNNPQTTLTFKDVHIPRRTNVTLEFFYTGNEIGGPTFRLNIFHVNMIRTISKAGFSVVDDFIDLPRPSTVFKKKKLHFHESNAALSKRLNDGRRVASESLHRSLFRYGGDSYGSPSPYTFSQSLEESHYRDDVNHKREAQYIGSSLSAPGVNVVSGYSELSYEPVVEIFITNPNQVIYNQVPTVTEEGQENPGNIAVTAGPPVIVQRPIRPTRTTGRPRVSYR